MRGTVDGGAERTKTQQHGSRFSAAGSTTPSCDGLGHRGRVPIRLLSSLLLLLLINITVLQFYAFRNSARAARPRQSVTAVMVYSTVQYLRATGTRHVACDVFFIRESPARRRCITTCYYNTRPFDVAAEYTV